MSKHRWSRWWKKLPPHRRNAERTIKLNLPIPDDPDVAFINGEQVRGQLSAGGTDGPPTVTERLAQHAQCGYVRFVDADSGFRYEPTSEDVEWSIIRGDHGYDDFEPLFSGDDDK